MKRQFLSITSSMAIALVLASGAVRAGGREVMIVQNATEVLDVSTKIAERCIPEALLSKAQGVLIVPNVVKAGFVVGGRHGRGVLLVRCAGGWSNPIFVNLTGGSFGWQAGIQSADLVLVFKTTGGVDRLLKGQNKLTLGGDASIAAGPVGRQGSAATDAMLKAEIFSYSRSRGLFLGVSLEGDSLRVDWPANANYYGIRDVTPAQIVAGQNLPVPESTLSLRSILSQRAGGEPPVVTPPPTILAPPPRLQPMQPPSPPPY